MNGARALILLYFTEFDNFAAYYVTVVEDRPIMSAEYGLILLAKTDSPCSAVSLRELRYLL